MFSSTRFLSLKHPQTITIQDLIMNRPRLLDFKLSGIGAERSRWWLFQWTDTVTSSNHQNQFWFWKWKLYHTLSYRVSGKWLCPRYIWGLPTPLILHFSRTTRWISILAFLILTHTHISMILPKNANQKNLQTVVLEKKVRDKYGCHWKSKICLTICECKSYPFILALRNGFNSLDHLPLS